MRQLITQITKIRMQEERTLEELDQKVLNMQCDESEMKCLRSEHD